MAEHTIYVYGTLRPGYIHATEKIRGALYDVGAFPALKFDTIPIETQDIVCEKITVDDEQLKVLDDYEGYFEEDHEGSLYLRRRYRDGWIYVFNRPVEGYPRIESGDWLLHKENLKSQ